MNNHFHRNKNSWSKRLFSVVLTTTLLISGFSLSGTPKTDGTAGAVQTGTALTDSTEENDNQITSTDYVEGEAVILLSDEARKRGLDSNAEKLDRALGEQIDVRNTYPLEDNSAACAVISSEKYSTDEIVKKLKNCDDIAYVEPNYVFRAHSIKNNPYSDEQWYLSNPDQPDSDVNYTDTLSYSPSSTPVVAVLDTGLTTSHKDLSGQTYGTTMYNSIRSSQESFYDDNGHGTHVAGVIAAAINDNSGMCGIAEAKILPIKCLDANGNGSSQSVLNAYYYIISLLQQGVNIKAINLSFGGLENYSSIFDQIIKTAGEAGAITVCSSGNEHVDIDSVNSYPAGFENDYLITVGSSNRSGQMASFSNYGQTGVDLFAPGTDIFSTYPKDDFNPELSHEYVYYTYEDNDTKNASVTNGSLSISDESNFTINGKNSLCWTLNATTPGSYELSLPYTISKKITSISYLALRFHVIDTSGKTETTIGTFDFADINPKKPGASAAGNTAHDNLTLASDYWIPSAVTVSSSLKPKASGTYEARLTLNLNTPGSYKIYVDNVGLGAHLYPYTYDTGTSMSSPIISGEIALLAGVYPKMSTDELRARIIGGVQTNASFQGKCTSGGKADFAKALSGDINPVITCVTSKDHTVTLSGYSFGSLPGQITLKDVISGNESNPPVKSWDDRSITFTVPDSDSCKYQITLTRTDGATHVYGGYFTNTPSTYIDKLSLTKKNITLSPGEKYRITPSYSPQNADNTKILYSTSNKKYATVDSTGLITAKKAGNKHNVTITLKAADRGQITVTCKVKIRQKVKKITLSRKNITLQAGKKKKLNAKVTPKTAVNKKITYKSSNKKYASVSKKGVVTAKKAGIGHTVTITLKSTDKSNIKKKVKVKII